VDNAVNAEAINTQLIRIGTAASATQIQTHYNSH